MTEPSIIEWPALDLDTLEWHPIEAYDPGAAYLPIVQDADNRTWLAQLDEKGAWREFIDGQLTRVLTPVRWAVPTGEIVDALAFG